MGAFSIWHLLIVLLVVMLVFGAGKVPRLMGDFAKGIKAFKSGMKEGVDPPAGSSSTPAAPSGHITEASASNVANESAKSTTTSGEKA